MLALLLAFLIFIFLFGGVSGTEFSPDSFQRRSFHYYQIPFLQIQVKGINREAVNNAFGQDLVVLKKITNKNTKNNRWILVRQSNSNYRSDAQILLDFLDASDGSSQEYWRQWTIDNDKLSDVLWPFVAKAARDDLYTIVPDIFELVHDDSKPDQLRSDLEATLSNRYTEAAQAEMDQQDYRRATDLLTTAISYNADNEEAKLLKTECDQQVGN